MCRHKDRFQRLLGLSFLLATPSWGASAPDFSITAQVAEQGGLAIRATPPPKHHINPDAPKSLRQNGSKEKIPPVKVTKDAVEFSLPDASRARAIEIELYLCDDANTFCERHSQTARWDGKKLAGTSGSETTPGTIPPRETSKLPTGVNKHGFILNDPERAFALAKKENKPILIDFYGIWCPPCNQLDEEVFSDPRFARATEKKWVKLKLDADHEVSWALKAHHKIGGYPTLLLVGPSGEERGRVVGFAPTEKILARFSQTQDPGLRHLERKEYADALKLLAGKPKLAEAFAKAEIGDLKSKFDEIPASETSRAKAARDQWMRALDSAIQKFPKIVESIFWRQTLSAELKSGKNGADGSTQAKRKVLLQEALSLTEAQITAAAAAPKMGGDETEGTQQNAGETLSLSDLWSTAGDLKEELGDVDGTRKAWAEAAKVLRARAKTGMERSVQLELAYAVWKAGDTPGAEAIYRKMEAAFPEEFTFFNGHASLLHKEKRDADALPLAKMAVARSYGDNRMRAVLLLAKIQDGLGETAQALTTLRETLDSIRAPVEKGVRAAKYLQQLRDYESELRARKSPDKG